MCALCWAALVLLDLLLIYFEHVSAKRQRSTAHQMYHALGVTDRRSLAHGYERLVEVLES